MGTGKSRTSLKKKKKKKQIRQEGPGEKRRAGKRGGQGMINPTTRGYKKNGRGKRRTDLVTQVGGERNSLPE